jgi:hypothetical protein
LPKGPVKDGFQWRSHYFQAMAQIALVRHRQPHLTTQRLAAATQTKDDTPAYIEVVARPLLNQLLPLITTQSLK